MGFLCFGKIFCESCDLLRSSLFSVDTALEESCLILLLMDDIKAKTIHNSILILTIFSPEDIETFLCRENCSEQHRQTQECKSDGQQAAVLYSLSQERIVS